MYEVNEQDASAHKNTRKGSTPSLRGRRVVEDQQVDCAVGELGQHALGGKGEQRLLELEGSQGRALGYGCDRSLNERGRGKEVSDERGHDRVDEAVERGRLLPNTLALKGQEVVLLVEAGVKVLRGVDRKEVSKETSDMGGSH